jgi:hypothetical protein
MKIDRGVSEAGVSRLDVSNEDLFSSLDNAGLAGYCSSFHSLICFSVFHE